LYFSPEKEEKLIEKHGIKDTVVISEYGTPDYNCYSFTFTDGEANHLTETQARTILRENGYYPIAGWSFTGTHPTIGWKGKQGYHAITSSDGDHIIRSDPVNGRSSKEVQKDDVIGYWQLNPLTGWVLTHTSPVTDVRSKRQEQEIYTKGKWGGPRGLYDHLASTPVLPRRTDKGPVSGEYGEALIIYHSDRPGGRHIQKVGLEDSEMMRILSMLRDTPCHAIASKFGPTSEQPRRGDFIVYWQRKPNSSDWSVASAAQVCDITPNGKIYVSIDSESDSGDSKSDDSNSEADFHSASKPGFPYTSWVIYRLGTSNSSKGKGKAY
jgi:hypothetical protein